MTEKNVAGIVKGSGRVLIVDDEPVLLKTFRYCLEDAGYKVTAAQNAAQAEAAVQRQVFDLCFLDLRLGETSGLDLLPVLKAAAPWLRVIIVTAHSSVDTAVSAMRAGATDYLIKPCSPEHLRVAAAKHLAMRRMELRIEELETGERERGEDPATQSQSPAMMQLLETSRQAADTDASVLILGESGTGKGKLARAIHGWSSRRGAAFVTINGPSLGADLFESTLFGHRRGAFTGAVETSAGRVGQADGGTLFLDEIGDVPLALQPKLLRFLQDKEYERVGEAETRHADVRLIAATNRDLAQMAADGRFREDLLYRIDVIRLSLPPLRERPEDVLVLADRFLAEFITQHRRQARGFSDDARAALLAYGWPGNVRELRNVIERASILCKDPQVERRHLVLATSGASPSVALKPGMAVSLQTLEREHIGAVIAASATLDGAAATLGIDVSTLYRKRKQYEI